MYLYAEYCPIAATTSVVGDYWTPLIVRELLYGTARFNQLARNLPNVSRPLLASRLRALERAGVVDCSRAGKNATSYTLTPAGRDLQRLLDAMNDWGLRWGTRDPNPRDLDPSLVTCMLKDRIRLTELPNRRVVIEVTAVGEREARAWLVCDRGSVSICFDPPAFDTDIWLRGDVAALYRVWLQRWSMTDALANGDIEAEGSADLIQTFPRWFDGSGGWNRT
jgi:DNA-binding HxlR family transcriptional regulator